MRNKRSFLLLTLLVLVFFLGIGYAVVSSINLEIGGTVDVQDADLKVAFNGTTEVSSEQKVIATSVDNSLNASIEVKDLELNEIVTATYYIRNKETDVNASISVDSIQNNKTEFFEVFTDIDTTAKTIEAGGVDSVKITVKLIKTPITTEDSKATIKVVLTASPTT